MTKTTQNPRADQNQNSAELSVPIGTLKPDWEYLRPKLKEFSKIENGKGVWLILKEWMMIAAAMGIAIYANNWFIYFISAVFIGTRQYSLGILVHEAMHSHLFTNRKVNDLVSELFLAFPMAISTLSYRHLHMLHHRNLNTENDPAYGELPNTFKLWKGSNSVLQWVSVLFREFFVISPMNELKMIRGLYPAAAFLGFKTVIGFSAKHRILFLSWICGVGILLSFIESRLTVMLLWIVPLFTVANFLYRLNDLAQHYGVENTHVLNATREACPRGLEKFFISPHNVHYHLTHHLFPYIPCYNLERMHDLLKQNKLFKQEAHFSNNMLGIDRGVISELAASK